jgi:hypothetical protein
MGPRSSFGDKFVPHLAWEGDVGKPVTVEMA